MSAHHRDGIRDLDHHASWREVYATLEVDTDQHEQEVVHEQS